MLDRLGDDAGQRIDFGAADDEGRRQDHGIARGSHHEAECQAVFAAFDARGALAASEEIEWGDGKILVMSAEPRADVRAAKPRVSDSS